MFSETAGFRHDSIPAGITAIQEIGAANGFAVDATEDSTAFTDANLAQYQAVICLSTTGDVLTDDEQAAFERFIAAGNGYVGIHAAADTEYGWDWYGDLVGAYFASHPPGTPAGAIDVEDADDASTTSLPLRWARTDEWYNYKPPAAGAARRRRRLQPALRRPRAGDARRDDLRRAGRQRRRPTTTRSPGARTSPAATPGTRACGHTTASYSEPDFRAHLLGGIQSVTDLAGAGCGAEQGALAERRRLREGHARRRHREPVRARHRPGRARLLHRARRRA